jgi:hypothetical protein
VPDEPVLSVSETSRDSCKVEWSSVVAPAFSSIHGYIVKIDNGTGNEVYTTVYDGSLNPSKLFTIIRGLKSSTTYNIIGYTLNKAGLSLPSLTTSCFTATTPG